MYLNPLNRISEHVHETHRVIANRVVQPRHVLRQEGIDVHQDGMLWRFSEQLPRQSGRYVFGELCANYANLRKQNSTHDQAMNMVFELL